MKIVTCTQCNCPIEFKHDLAVAGKMLSPYHKKCLENPDSKLGKLHKFIGPFPLGLKFFLWLLIGNLILMALIMRHPEDFCVLIVFQVVANAVWILARIGITLAYERHLR